MWFELFTREKFSIIYFLCKTALLCISTQPDVTLQVITEEEAEKRGKAYDAESMTYLFDLDFMDENQFAIDAKMMGNISHFVNHSVYFPLTLRQKQSLASIFRIVTFYYSATQICKCSAFGWTT